MVSAAFFFDALASSTGAAYASWRHLLIEQLLASPGRQCTDPGRGIRQDAVATVAELDGFQTGEQTTWAVDWSSRDESRFRLR
jgi:hypothetical protein